MERILLALAIAGAAVALAVVLQRRRPDPPSSGAVDFTAPSQLDRDDFGRAQAPWLVVLFSSATCSTCADVEAKVAVLESTEVAVQVVEAVADADTHRRYGIEAVPITVIADADGVVGASFVGPVSATHLWAALAEMRDPGSVPPGCGGHDNPA